MGVEEVHTFRGEIWKRSYSKTLRVTGTEAPFGNRVKSPEKQIKFLLLEFLFLFLTNTRKPIMNLGYKE